NGHPFIPPVRVAAAKSGTRANTVLMRGIEIPLPDVEPDQRATAAGSADAGNAPRLRSVQAVAGAEQRASTASDAKRADEQLSPEVERMVELLLKGNTDPQRVPLASPKVSPKESRPVAAEPARVRPEPSAVEVASADSFSVFSSDPSYVFFRQIADSDGGPLGALGVPLTPGRSVAVDPRTTP